MSMVKDVFFDFDKYELRSDARAVLQENARLLKENGGNVVLEGHCDERGTEEYNLALGERRAGAARAYLSDLGVDASMLSTVSYGEEKPFATGSDESAWSQNRRVHFRIE
jgi:peptidoglycan-associated lipoprotein